MKLLVKHGTEGPQYDPYSFTERTVDHGDGLLVTLHLGLGEWCHIKDTSMDLDCNPADEKSFSGYSPVELFEHFSGLTPHQFDKYYDRIHGTCKKCGNHRRFNYCDGYPGETFKMCAICDEIVDVEVDMSAVE